MSVGEDYLRMGDGSAARNAHLQAIIDDCRCRRIAGELVSDDVLIAAHSELMPELGEELRKLRLIAAPRQQAAQPIAPEVATRSHHNPDTGSGSGRLEVRCPSCHSPMEVAVDTQLTDLTCSSCGSHFSLVDQSKATRMAPSLTKLGRFELIERLGVGGFGSVWKARDKELDRTVAIKIPRAGAMTGEDQEKFFREARAAAQLRHPSIVSVHEVGRDGDSVYIVSDFVRGVTLGDWLTGQQLTSRETAELCAKIADALHHAHEQGVVHRDLKPANIMIDGDGQPHLMDFGLARREVGEVSVTMDGQVLGTPAYMSPEQAEGKAHTADRRSDVYSLGVILFQLLTGELPFRGNARMLMHQVIHDEPPSPRKLNSNVAKDLETITLKCMEKDPACRYESAQEVADELRRYLGGKPIEARPVGRVERAWRWCRRNPSAAILSAALIFILLTISTVAPIIAARQTSLRHVAEAAESEATHEAATSKRLADVESAKYALSQGRISEAYQEITAAIKGQPSLEYGRILDQVIDQARNDWRLVQRIPMEGKPNWCCFVGPGPKWFVLSRGDKIEVRSLLRDQVFAAIQVPGGGYASRAIGAARLAVATAPGRITLYALPRLDVVAQCDLPGKIIEIRSDFKGHYFVALSNDGLVRVFDNTGRQFSEHHFALVDKVDVVLPSVDISPSGKTILFNPGTSYAKKTFWKWEASEPVEVKIDTFLIRFESDDRAYGISTNGAKRAAVCEINLSDYVVNPIPCYEPQPFLYTDGSTFEGAADRKSQTDLACVCDDTIHLITESKGTNRHLEMSLTRYHSLWPHAPDPPRFAAYDSATHTLALTTDREIILFNCWLPRRSTIDTRTHLETQNSILERAGDRILTCRGSTINILNLSTLDRTEYTLRQPDRGTAMLDQVRCLATTPNAQLIAVLWRVVMAESQANSNNLRNGSKQKTSVTIEASEKPALNLESAKDAGGQTLPVFLDETTGTSRDCNVIQIYEALNSAESRSLRFIREFETDDRNPDMSNNNSRLLLSSTGRTVAFCDQGKHRSLVGYTVADGKCCYRVPITEFPTFAACSDSTRIGIGDYRREADYLVFDVETGEQICKIPGKSPLLRAAFSPDGKFVYLRWASPRAMKKYRISDGALVAEITTPVLPVNIFPSQDRFVGFAADAPRVGSLVLGDIASGKTLEIIRDDAFIRDDAQFSATEDKVVFVENPSECGIMSLPDTARAISQLEETAIDPELAALSSDILDYRERLARNYETHAEESNDIGSAEAKDQLRKALDVRKQLYADFPNIAKYGEVLAADYDAMATFLEARRGRSEEEGGIGSVGQIDWSPARENLEHSLDARKTLATAFPNVAQYKADVEMSRKRLVEFNARHKLNNSDSHTTQQ